MKSYTPTPHAKVSQDKKYAAVAELIESQGLLAFPEKTDTPTREKMTRWFITDLVAMLDENREKRSNPATEWLRSDFQLILHPRKPALYTPVEQAEDEPTRIHMVYDAQANAATQLSPLLEKARRIEPKDSKEVYVAESTSADLVEESPGKIKIVSSGARSLYNPEAQSLPWQYAKKHSRSDLRTYGAMRRESAEGGGMWLWQRLHAYLLDEETLKTKEPARWFRDMCVVCGISTLKLESLAGHTQKFWTQVQNDSELTARSPARRAAIRRVLSLQNTIPPTHKYDMPEGSIFGLPLVSTNNPAYPEQKEVSPEALDRIEKLLFHTNAVFKPVDALHNLCHISEAHRAGAISKQELLESNVLKATLHKILKQYPIYAQSNRKETNAVNNFISNTNIDLTPVVGRLRHINDSYLKIPAKEFDAIIDALRWFPTSDINMCRLGETDRQQAWEYAKIHHTHGMGDLLATYRFALGKSRVELAQRAGVLPESIKQYEVINEMESIARRAQSLYQNGTPRLLPNGQPENLWQLPTDADHKLLPDVLHTLTHYQSQPRPRPPAKHWNTLIDVIDSMAGTPATQSFDMAQYRAYPIMGKHTEAFKQSQEHPILAKAEEVIWAEIEKHPGIPFHSIPLPTGGSMLVKHDARGQISIWDNDQAKLKAWLLTLKPPPTPSHNRPV